MKLSLILDLLVTVFLQPGANVFPFNVNALLYIIGLWGLFRKCGIKSWWALVPFARDAKLGEAADMEKEGRVLALVTALSIALEVVRRISLEGKVLADVSYIGIVEVLGIFLSLIILVYKIRICLSLINVFGRKKRWLLMAIFADGVWFFLWGWLKRYQPRMTVQQIKGETEDFFSNSRAAVLDQGLTVNLEERTVRDFLKKKYLLRDIHMYIQPGHMVLLLGGSGAGKTTFLNAVNGYEKAKAEVVLNGQNMYKSYREMQYDIGFVPQQDLMRGSDTVYRTLMDAAALRLPDGFTRAQRQSRVEEVMDIFGLTPVRSELVVKLSGGQRKRLSIAMEFISNPSLFILDEPDSGLDGVMARELFQQLRKIADQGKIIIVITHTPDRVIDMFDDVIVLAKDSRRTGRLAYFGPVAEAREFFSRNSMEEIVRAVNREEEGGDGLADEFVRKYAEVQHV